MSQDEEDRIVGRLFRESGDARRNLALLDTELKNVRDGLKNLYSELPELKSIMLDSRHASLGKYVNLEAIRGLLESKEDAARKVEDFEKRVHPLRG
jgi:hypothetical protein